MSGYIGTQPVPQATQTRDTFTATAGQTSFATSGYTPGFLDVFLNGVHLVNGTDYTASNGSDVVLTSGAASGDNLEVVAYTTFQTGDFVPTSGGTFSGNVTVNGNFTVGTAAYPTSGPLSNRNKIINGGMVIDQRNAGASFSPTTSAGTSLDRWTARITQNSKLTIQQNAGSVTPPAGFTNYLGVTSSSAYSVPSTDVFTLVQAIEGFNVADLGFGTANAQTITLSFWVRSSLTGSFGGAFINGANDRSYPFAYTISAADTWEYKTVTVAGDTTGTWLTNNGNGLEVRFGLGSGSNYTGTANVWGTANAAQPPSTVSVVGTSGATFYITGVQLEAGDTATPFEHRNIGQELLLCQRYYQLFGRGTAYGRFGAGQALISTLGNAEMPLIIEMRASPTISGSAASAFAFYTAANIIAATGISIDSSSNKHVTLLVNVASGLVQGNAGSLIANNSTSAFIAFSAEL